MGRPCRKAVLNRVATAHELYCCEDLEFQFYRHSREHAGSALAGELLENADHWKRAIWFLRQLLR